MASIMASFQAIEPLRIVFHEHEEDRSQEDLTALAESLRAHDVTLRRVELGGLDLDLLRTVCPVALTLPELTELQLDGCWMSRDLITVDSSNDARMVAALLQKESLAKLSLHHMRITSDEGTSFFCDAIAQSHLDDFSLDWTDFSTNKDLDLIKSFADSRFRRLNFRGSVTKDALLAFAPAFAASSRSVMEDLSIAVPRARGSSEIVYRYFLFRGEVSSRRLPDEWVNQVKRALDIHRERRLSLPMFQKFRESEEAGGPVRFANVFAVHPAIVFQYLRNDEFKLLKAIREASDGGGSLNINSSSVRQAIHGAGMVEVVREARDKPGLVERTCNSMRTSIIPHLFVGAFLVALYAIFLVPQLKFASQQER